MRQLAVARPAASYCLVDRSLFPSPPSSGALHLLSLAAPHAVLALCLLLREPASVLVLDTRRALLAWPSAVLVYVCLYVWVSIAKELQGDRTCSRLGSPRSNGISGHTLCHAYYALATLHAALSTARAATSGAAAKKRALLGAWAVQAALSAHVLARTYAGGYHSARQMLAGLACALLGDAVRAAAARVARRSQEDLAGVTGTLMALAAGGVAASAVLGFPGPLSASLWALWALSFAALVALRNGPLFSKQRLPQAPVPN
eukprot:m51a1_g567 hypothetical protein (260) ;mRNA; f:510800-511702